MTKLIPDTMTAVLLTGHGGLEKLEYRNDIPVPAPGPREVLIRVGAAGINNTDINTRTAWYSKSVTTDTNTGGESGFVRCAIPRSTPRPFGSGPWRRARLVDGSQGPGGMGWTI